MILERVNSKLDHTDLNWNALESAGIQRNTSESEGICSSIRWNLLRPIGI